ncbi:8d2874f3-cc57-490c-a5c1-a955192527dc [Thermothielavioides terrestris]|nr:8d2874f3-cc57-490c-a5c1-a955192527dc [Thermothielavioides terrestris]
MATAES